MSDIDSKILYFIRKTLLFILVLHTISVKGQYREMIYYKVPLGAIKYFHPDEIVFYKLRSEDKFDIRKGPIKLITDTLYEIGNVRFKPDNLKWISSKPTKSQRVLKSLAGSLILLSGLASVAYGITVFPEADLRKKDPDAYHSGNINAIKYSLGGLALAAISIPVYQMHPRHYAVSKRWKVKYQR